jgi:hypothetical protein
VIVCEAVNRDPCAIEHVIVQFDRPCKLEFVTTVLSAAIAATAPGWPANWRRMQNYVPIIDRPQDRVLVLGLVARDPSVYGILCAIWQRDPDVAMLALNNGIWVFDFLGARPLYENAQFLVDVLGQGPVALLRDPRNVVYVLGILMDTVLDTTGMEDRVDAALEAGNVYGVKDELDAMVKVIRFALHNVRHAAQSIHGVLLVTKDIIGTIRRGFASIDTWYSEGLPPALDSALSRAFVMDMFEWTDGASLAMLDVSDIVATTVWKAAQAMDVGGRDHWANMYGVMPNDLRKMLRDVLNDDLLNKIVALGQPSVCTPWPDLFRRLRPDAAAAAVLADPSTLRHLPDLDTVETVSEGPVSLLRHSTFRSTDVNVIRAVLERDGTVIQHVHEYYADQMDIACVAVEQNGEAFKHLPIRRQDDTELLDLAMKTYPRAYLSASERCRRDNTEHAVTAAVDLGNELPAYILCFAPVAGEVFARAVLKQDPSLLPCLMCMIPAADRVAVTVAVLWRTETDDEARGIVARLTFTDYNDMVGAVWDNLAAQAALGVPA